MPGARTNVDPKMHWQSQWHTAVLAAVLERIKDEVKRFILYPLSFILSSTANALP
jgi:hypothetical protein